MHELCNRLFTNEWKCWVNRCHLSRIIKLYDSPLALFAVSIVRQAMMTRAPRLAKSRAVSFPMPLLAPVINTVFPSIRTCEISKHLLDEILQCQNYSRLSSFPVMKKCSSTYIRFKLSTCCFQPQPKNYDDCYESKDDGKVNAHGICVWNLVPSHSARKLK